jgi:hypothetical protein
MQPNLRGLELVKQPAIPPCDPLGLDPTCPLCLALSRSVAKRGDSVIWRCCNPVCGLEWSELLPGQATGPPGDRAHMRSAWGVLPGGGEV